jgi:hypothetical protein
MTSGVVVSLVRLGGLAVWCAACALGQSAQLREPRLGYVFTASEASLRPMVGIPATAVLAAPNPLPGAPASVTLSPLQDFALLVGADGSLILWDLRAEPASGLPLPPLDEPAQRVVLSPMGSAALVLGAGTERAFLLAGLPDSPQLVGTLELELLPGAPGAVAVSDDAGAVVAVIAIEGGHAVYGLAAGQTPVRLWLPGETPEVAFFDRRPDVALVDRTNDQVLMIRHVGGDAEVVVLAGREHGILSPRAVRPYPDGQRLAVLHSGGIAIVDVGGGVIHQVACPFTAAGIERLGPGALFRLTDASTPPVWLLDGEVPEPRVLFVPLARRVARDPEVQP